MALYELGDTFIRPLDETSFSAAHVKERDDLQRILRENIGVILDDAMVLAEEFCNWEDSRRRIDLLCLDRSANLVVVELKRTEDGGHMDLQAIRYAAMVSTLTFEQAVAAHATHLARHGRAEDAGASILRFLGWPAPDEERFAQEVRIVLVAAEFSKEVTSSVLWLLSKGLDITCIRMKPYKLADRLLLNVDPIIPLPEAQEYQVRVAEKDRQVAVARHSTRERQYHTLVLGDERHEGLSSRTMILRLIRGLVSRGVGSPREISAAVPWRGSRLYCSVEGVGMSGGQFIEAMTRDRREQGKTFDPRRFFCGDDELLAHGDRTYAISNQWTSEDALRVVSDLQQGFPGHGFGVDPGAE